MRAAFLMVPDGHGVHGNYLPLRSKLRSDDHAMSDRPLCLCTGRDDIHCDDSHCDIAGPGEPGNPNQCRVCWLRLRHAPRSLSCIHLGGATGETIQCPTCPSGGHTTNVPVLACAIHGTTTGKRGSPASSGIRSCFRCPDHHAPDPFGGEIVRNLLMHVCPIAGNGVWQRVVSLVLRRIKLFNGRRVVAIVTGSAGEPPPGPTNADGWRVDGTLDPPEHVMDAFAGAVHEFVVVPNDPALREVTTYEELFGRVETTSPRQVTLYCHAKGVTRPPDHIAHDWTRLLVETNLDYWPWIERLLREYPCAASFLRYIKAWRESPSEWHPSGSWWWFRNRDWFLHEDWRTRIDRFWSGIEGVASRFFTAEQVGPIFFPFHRGGPGLYDWGFFKGEVLPAYEQWKTSRAGERKEW
jgi:hypothetical protein